MKIFSAEQVRAWDAYTITHEPIASVDLMERAAAACVAYLDRHFPAAKGFLVFCGPGNNGGDGLAIARLLHEKSHPVELYALEKEGHSADYHTNSQRLGNIPLQVWKSGKMPDCAPGTVIIDALFGSGLNRKLEGKAAQLVQWINRQEMATVVAVDLPSGLPFEPERATKLQKLPIVKADITLSFQVPKPSFLIAETAEYVGQFELLDIGLSEAYAADTPSKRFYLAAECIAALYKPREKFAHKGRHGHALLLAGSYGKSGAALMAARACLRSGAGLLTAHVPGFTAAAFPAALPEAMLSIDPDEQVFTGVPDELLLQTKALGIGPGLGSNAATEEAVLSTIDRFKGPMVIDADALNILAFQLAQDPDFHLPVSAILTPHVKEFERLAGPCSDSAQRLQKQLEFSARHQVFVLLKGAHSSISTPGGDLYFNSSGNPGMAKGGSGDVLTGLILALLAQGYQPLQAALMGMWIHGRAADLCLEQGMAPESMLATDIIEMLPQVFKQVAAAYLGGI